MNQQSPLLVVENIKTIFNTKHGKTYAVNDVSFTLHKGEFLGVVGESGSGKSVTMLSLMHLLSPPQAKTVRAETVQGRAFLEGVDILRLNNKALSKLRGAKIGFIFQDPVASLNPVLSIGEQVSEGLRKHKKLSKKEALERTQCLLELVGIRDAKRCLSDYPHQLSGGQCQRVMIAIALSCDPEILIADEPTTALDVTTQAQILELISNLQKKLGMAVIWVTHDLGVIAGIAERVLVMYGGQIVEQAPVKSLFYNPRHPYTQALLKTLPDVHSGTQKHSNPLYVIAGQPPSLNKEPRSCSFRNRCPQAFDLCAQKKPQRLAIDGLPIGQGHDFACHLATHINQNT